MDPRPMSLCRFSDECLPEEYRGHYPMDPSRMYLYLGEIVNMPGHVAVIDTNTNEVHFGYHPELFTEIDEDGDFR